MCVQTLMGSFLDCEGSSVAADDSTPPRRPASGFIAPHLLTAFDASGDACRDDAWCWSGEESESWASGWLCWKVFMPFLLLAQLLASNSDSAREKWQERLESLLISVWNWKPTGIIPFGFRKRFTSWRPCEFSPLEAWKHFSCHSVACRHGVLFTRGVNQGSRSVWSFCKTLYFNKEKQKWQPDQCFSIYLFSKNKRAHLRKMCLVSLWETRSFFQLWWKKESVQVYVIYWFIYFWSTWKLQGRVPTHLRF